MADRTVGRRVASDRDDDRVSKIDCFLRGRCGLAAEGGGRDRSPPTTTTTKKSRPPFDGDATTSAADPVLPVPSIQAMRVATAAAIWRRSPGLTLPQAMRAAEFTAEEIREKRVQMSVRRRVPRIKERRRALAEARAERELEGVREERERREAETKEEKREKNYRKQSKRQRQPTLRRGWSATDPPDVESPDPKPTQKGQTSAEAWGAHMAKEEDYRNRSRAAAAEWYAAELGKEDGMSAEQVREAMLEAWDYAPSARTIELHVAQYYRAPKSPRKQSSSAQARVGDKRQQQPTLPRGWSDTNPPAKERPAPKPARKRQTSAEAWDAHMAEKEEDYKKRSRAAAAEWYAAELEKEDGMSAQQIREAMLEAWDYVPSAQTIQLYVNVRNMVGTPPSTPGPRNTGSENPPYYI